MSATQEIESRVQAFVADLTDLVRRQALEAVAQALGTGGARRGPGRPRAAAPAPASGAAARVRARKKGEKRSPAELVAIERALFEHVRGNPGQGIEAIGKALALPTSELARPMKKLVARGDVKTQGAKRATKYFASDGASGPGEGGAAPTRARAGRRAGGKRSKKKAKA